MTICITQYANSIVIIWNLQYINNWRAIKMSETLSRVAQYKISFMFLFIYILYVWTYMSIVFWPSVFAWGSTLFYIPLSRAIFFKIKTKTIPMLLFQILIQKIWIFWRFFLITKNWERSSVARLLSIGNNRSCQPTLNKVGTHDFL